MDTVRGFLLSVSGEYLLGFFLTTALILTFLALYLMAREAIRERKQAREVRAEMAALIHEAAERHERKKLGALSSAYERRKN